MLAVLMYHRVSQTPFSHKQGLFEQHLTWLAKNYPIVLPGDPLEKNKINICLTFDDAYFDFYHQVFPLLTKLDTRALLAIPSGLILDKTHHAEENRLQIPYHQALKAHESHATLCTWEEIKVMTASKLVMPACHGLTHQRLTTPGLSLEKEIVDAKRLLEEKTQQKIETFVYPYGAMNRPAHALVNQHYRYAMRIGSALNRNWHNLNQVIYRINAEDFWPKEKALFTLRHQLSLWFRYVKNTLRFK